MDKPKIPLRAKLAAAVIDQIPDWSAMLATRCLGSVARIRAPRPIGRAVIAAYCRYFGVEASEIQPLALAKGFPSFDEFFTRQLVAGSRPITRDPGLLVSPSDGLLRDVSPIARDTAIRAKGHEFSVGELLADDDVAKDFMGGLHATIYLHPRDYHRVHSPCDGELGEVTLVPGRLLPVTSAALERCPNLFAINERLVQLISTDWGKVAVVMVAAFGVGHMTCAHVDLDPHPTVIRRSECEPPIPVCAGDEVGMFHLGSTVIVLTSPGVGPLDIDAGAGLGPDGRRIEMGQPLLRLEGRA